MAINFHVYVNSQLNHHPDLFDPAEQLKSGPSTFKKRHRDAIYFDDVNGVQDVRDQR
jgi:hypothetical protein